jgi:anti-sigma28 factor (negative regulator of flagellin synthesis)
MKVTESNPLGNLGLGGVSSSAHTARTQPVAEAAAPQSELSITAASQAIFAGRPERIAELKNQFEKGTYSPNSQGTSEKLVSEALSRPA